MSQGQPRRETASQQEAITYGDVFPVSRNLAAQPITQQDAALMQSAETRALGQTQKGGVAATMQAAADLNEREGLVDRSGDTLAGALGMGVTEAAVPGRKVTTEYIAGQSVLSDAQPTPTDYLTAANTDITIGEAMEAAAVKAGEKPVEQSDAAAIQSAERRATGIPETLPGGVTAAAQAAADANPRLRYEEGTTLADVICTATRKLSADKGVTMEDARKIMDSEARQSATGQAFPGGVGDAMVAAARINE